MRRRRTGWGHFFRGPDLSCCQSRVCSRTHELRHAGTRSTQGSARRVAYGRAPNPVRRREIVKARHPPAYDEAAMRAERWEPVIGIEGPMDHIDFSYTSASKATVSNTFAGSGGLARTLILRFTHVVVLAGEDEAPGGFIAAPAAQSLPKLERGGYPSWTFPLLRLFESQPLNQYQMMRPQQLAHFYLVSLHNLVHVIASADVEASWLTS